MVLNFLSLQKKNNIPIDAITCNKNKKLLKQQSKKYKINNIFNYDNNEKCTSLVRYITSTKLNIIYFLDHGSGSLSILSKILKYQKGTTIAVANKEMIIAGNKYMIDRIEKTNNKFIPLDSEHFSLINSKLDNSDIKNLYITASGGPFYSNKNINLNNVKKKDVLSHPKWKMGNNNLIDSSNFINKILEIFEMSIIYKIDIKKIDFLVSPNAFIHSLVVYNDYIHTFNCFNNDMLITLTKPLKMYYLFKLNLDRKKFLNYKNYYFEKFSDKRFKIIKYYHKLKNLDHSGQIEFMILNNIAQDLYLKNIINYNDIVRFITKRISFSKNDILLSSFDDILKYIKNIKIKYKDLYV